MASAVADLLHQRDLRGVTLVGHSLGAAVAYRVAVSATDRLARLVVEDAPPPYDRDVADPVQVEPAVGYDWAVVPAVVREVGIRDAATWTALETLPLPVLVVAGGPTSHVPQELLADVVAAVPRGRLVTLPVGHHVHSGDPAAFLDAVLAWLEAPP